MPATRAKRGKKRIHSERRRMAIVILVLQLVLFMNDTKTHLAECDLWYGFQKGISERATRETWQRKTFKERRCTVHHSRASRRNGWMTPGWSVLMIIIKHRSNRVGIPLALKLKTGKVSYNNVGKYLERLSSGIEFCLCKRLAARMQFITIKTQQSAPVLRQHKCHSVHKDRHLKSKSWATQKTSIST